MSAIDVKVPRLAESISEAVLAEWLKEDGASVRQDEPIATLETDKAAVEIAAPEAGTLRHARSAGDKVVVDDVIARVEAGAAAAATSAPSAAPASAKTPAPPSTSMTPAPSNAGPPSAPARNVAPQRATPESTEAEPLSPAVRRLLEQYRLEPRSIQGTGKGGRLLKEDVLKHLEASGIHDDGSPQTGATPTAEPAAPRAPAPPKPAAPSPTPTRAPARPAPAAAGEGERAVPMTRIRQRIAERLVEAQHQAAILTTFNEIDMSAVQAARARHRESFEKKHGVRLGFMSFFARASIMALEEIPELNAEIRGQDIVYRDHVHLGIAVQTDRGLMVPVVRDAHRLGFAEIEREIVRLAERARDHTLQLSELLDGTFTISNGGIYGSLLSTPILNPPQSGILGMHKIEKRPIAVDDQVVIRPMMYVALSYDHRIVDGEQAVTFLVRVKERLEDPERMLLDV
jgi:2-oxoglutarate dehydrogenase E2 component (dihydrolipoamide succinyltransferase)